MDAAKLEKLVKLLNLARSDQPHEAMIAIKRATEMVDYDWARFFAKLATPSYQSPSSTYYSPPVSKTKAEIIARIEALDDVEDDMTPSQHKWFCIVRDAFRQRGKLSPKQLEVLRNVYDGVFG